MSSNLDTYWDNLDFKKKQKLQYLVFPDGLFFDKKTGTVRTDKTNEVFNSISCFSAYLKENKKGQIKKKSDLSPLVEPQGFYLIYSFT